MFNKKFDDQSDDISTEPQTQSALATLEPEIAEDAAPSEWTGSRCEKCRAPIKSDVVTICRSCGWYPKLGRHLEVDPNWEADEDSAQPAGSGTQKSTLRVWFELLPRWSWLIIG